MFQTVFPSIIRSLRAYTQHQAYVIQVHSNAFTLETGHEGLEREYKYGYTLSLTSALDRVVVNATSRPLYPWEKDSIPVV
jgi:hypothetical protein